MCGCGAACCSAACASCCGAVAASMAAMTAINASRSLYHDTSCAYYGNDDEDSDKS